MKTEKARLDTDGTAKPKTTLISPSKQKSGDTCKCGGPCNCSANFGPDDDLTLVSEGHPPIKVR